MRMQVCFLGCSFSQKHVKHTGWYCWYAETFVLAVFQEHTRIQVFDHWNGLYQIHKQCTQSANASIQRIHHIAMEPITTCHRKSKRDSCSANDVVTATLPTASCVHHAAGSLTSKSVVSFLCLSRLNAYVVAFAIHCICKDWLSNITCI